MKRTSKLFAIAVTLFVAAAFTLSANGQGDGETIKIGVAGPHSGDLASYGIPTVKAAELVAEKVNAAGGIDGRMIELVIEDDVCKPEVAANTAAKLVGDGVVAVIGHICSGATKSAMGTYLDSELLAISPSATNPPLTQSGDYPNFFRTIAPDDAQAAVEVAFAYKMGYKKIAVLHDKGDYGKGFAEFCKAILEADGKAEVVLYEGITPGAVDYTAVINKIASSGAEAVIFGGYHPEASKLITQMKKKDMDIAFLSDDGVKDDTFIKVAGEYAEGVYATGPIDTSSNPMAIEAVKAHQDKYGEDPGAFFINAYAAMLALVNAIDVADSTEYADLTNALRSNYVDTPLGSISFDEKGDAIGVGFAVYQVQNGQYVELK
ncbi:branched-chain amino acid ABC transporter substrate-binding protein [Spirochaeta isovalerica]|uniref:Branched-chain amino acid transport system substrate-binding protein n=1 Tax=Spirochaeta isovalerica TaxID=150 RepID=A0A841RFM1_9SPIO|nr:branched-chain amino acid ABC transporter substrate-binding protein [Spirochaeta isovalerica]MBB6481368.1 branched-chain amino acid transport system substrate-binding protein [Spirochaeta isovalerica]